MTSVPPTIGVPTAARLLGISRGSAYELLRTGAFPTGVLRFGRRIRIPTRPLLQLLGVPADEAEDVIRLATGGVAELAAEVPDVER